MPTISALDSALRALRWAGIGTLAAAVALIGVGIGALAQLHAGFSVGIAAVLIVYGLAIGAAGWLAVRGHQWVSGIIVAAAVLHVLAVGEMALNSDAWWLWLIELPLVATVVLGALSRSRRARWEASVAAADDPA